MSHDVSRYRQGIVALLLILIGPAAGLGAARPEPVPARISALLEDLRSDELKVQRDALNALEAMGATAISGLIGAARDPDPWRRSQAVELLGRMGRTARDSRSLLVEVLSDPAPAVRRQAAWALGRIGPLEPDASAFPVQEALIQVMDDPDWNVRADATWAIGKINRNGADDEALKAVMARLRDGSGHVRWSAVWALARMSAPASLVVPALTALLQDDSWRLRASAAIVLARLADGRLGRELLPRLRALLRDPHPLVRSRAGGAILRIQRGLELST